MLIAGVAATMWFSPLSANQSSQPAPDRAQEHLALVEQAYAARQGPEGETWRGRTAVNWTLAGFTMLLAAYVGSKVVLELILKRG